MQRLPGGPAGAASLKNLRPASSAKKINKNQALRTFVHKAIDFCADTDAAFQSVGKFSSEAEVSKTISEFLSSPAVRAVALLFANGTEFAARLRLLNTLSLSATHMLHGNSLPLRQSNIRTDQNAPNQP